MTGSRPCARTESGFTLVELVIATAILGTVILISTTILLGSSRLEARTARRAAIQLGSRQALSLMTTELRQAGADPGVPPLGIVGIVDARANLVRVRADLNGDRVIQNTEPSEDVTYRWNDTTRTVLRDPGTGATPVLSNVTAMTLSYFDAANQPLGPLPLSATDAARVHAIGLTFTSQDRDSRPMTLTTRITLRNM